MNIIKEFINDYGVAILHSILTGVFSYVALETKKIYKKVAQDKIKKEVENLKNMHIRKENL